MALSPLSGTLSHLGAEVKRDRIALASKLIKKITGFSQCENFDIALEFALYNIEHHKFLDVDPDDIEQLYSSLQDRLDRNSMLSKKKKLDMLKKRVLEIEVEPSALVRDVNYRILSLLYWLAGNPISVEGNESNFDLNETSIAENRNLPQEEVDNEDSEDLLTESESELYVCNSSSSLSDWDLSDEEGTVQQENAAPSEIHRTSEGEDASHQGAVSTSKPSGSDMVKTPMSLREQYNIVFSTRDQILESEVYVIRKVILMLHGTSGNGEVSIKEELAQQCGQLTYSPATMDSIWALLSDVSETVKYLKSSVENGNSFSLFPTLSSYLEGLRCEMNPFFNFLIDLEKKIMLGHYFTLLQLVEAIQMNMHVLQYLEAVSKTVFSSFSPADPAVTIASSILSSLDELWSQSDLQSDFDSFSPSAIGLRLFKKSFGPYSNYLSLYLSEGRLRDPSEEFFICIDPTVEVNSESFWSLGHSLRSNRGGKKDCIPSFIVGLEHKILAAGKALCLLQKDLDRPSGFGQSISDFQKGERDNNLEAFYVPFVTPLEHRREDMHTLHEGEAMSVQNDLDEEGPRLIRMIRDGFQGEDPTSVLHSLQNTFANLHTHSKDFRIAQEIFRANSLHTLTAKQTEADTALDDNSFHNKLCPPQMLVEDLIKDPIIHRCACIQNTLINSLRDEYKLLDALEKLKKVFLYGSDAMLNFMYTSFDRMSMSNFWDDEIELASSFQEYAMQDLSNGDLENVGIKLQKNKSNHNSGIRNVNSNPYRAHTMDEVERIHLTYELSWPLNIFINEATFEKYNDVFVFLSQVKSAEHALHKLFSLKGKMNQAKAITMFWKANGIDFLRHELSHFVGVLHQYIVDQVISAGWKKAHERMRMADTIDALCRAHNDFLSSAMQQCLVGSDKLWVLLSSRIKSILNLVLQFCALAQELCNTNEVSASFFADVKTRYEKLQQDFQENRNFLLTILSSKIRLGSVPQLYDLLMRLNYNEFYNI